MHEPVDNSSPPALPTERNFGLVFAAAFSVLGGLRTWHGHGDGLVWFAVAAVFAAMAWLWPAPLRPLNLVWARLGALLHRIVTPALMGVIFFGVFAPMGVLMRLLGKDPLRLRRDPQATTYWLACPDARSRPGAMKDQF